MERRSAKDIMYQVMTGYDPRQEEQDPWPTTRGELYERPLAAGKVTSSGYTALLGSIAPLAAGWWGSSPLVLAAGLQLILLGVFLVVLGGRWRQLRERQGLTHIVLFASMEALAMISLALPAVAAWLLSHR